MAFYTKHGDGLVYYHHGTQQSPVSFSFMWSEDGGQSFSKAKVLITNYPFDAGNRPYVKYYSKGENRIHLVFTDGHPRNESKNSVYYAYYEGGAFWKVNGDKICTLEELPFSPKDASLVYQGSDQQGRAWVYDISADEQNRPIIAYARYLSEEEHIYHYTRYDGKNSTTLRIKNKPIDNPPIVQKGFSRPGAVRVLITTSQSPQSPA